jgi:hypothetical protein
VSDPGDTPGGKASDPLDPAKRPGTPESSRQHDSTRPSRGGQLVIGRLTEHGRAHYQFRAGEDLSYYLKLLTSQGERTLWGKDLERALSTGETKPKVGDLIGARRVARRAVTITTRARDSEGRVLRQEEHHAHRTRWVVEKVKFFAERARLARQLREEQLEVRESVRTHPELKSTFLSIRAAEAFADQRIADPKDRERFLELVRGAMAGSIHKGAPLPSVKLRDPRTRSNTTPITRTPPKREEPTR